MSLRRRIEDTIESVFRTLFPWAVGESVYAFHVGLLGWVSVYHAIYVWTGAIHPVSWWLLLGFYVLLVAQFLVLGRCVLSAIEKRLTGRFVDLHGPVLRLVGLERFKPVFLAGHFAVLAASLMCRELFIGLLRECFSWLSRRLPLLGVLGRIPLPVATP
jgi:hypothetical protein